MAHGYLKNMLVKYAKVYSAGVKKHALNIQENSVHGSDSLENAKIEISFFFSQIELVN